ncbi:MAG: hypothetical protein AB1589_07920 [Cyanobacteriota bacterium]
MIRQVLVDAIASFVIAINRTLFTNPPLLILDESTGALDPGICRVSPSRI